MNSKFAELNGDSIRPLGVHLDPSSYPNQAQKAHESTRQRHKSQWVRTQLKWAQIRLRPDGPGPSFVAQTWGPDPSRLLVPQVQKVGPTAPRRSQAQHAPLIGLFTISSFLNCNFFLLPPLPQGNFLVSPLFERFYCDLSLCKNRKPLNSGKHCFDGLKVSKSWLLDKVHWAPSLRDQTKGLQNSDGCHLNVLIPSKVSTRWGPRWPHRPQAWLFHALERPAISLPYSQWDGAIGHLLLTNSTQLQEQLGFDPTWTQLKSGLR